jgi:hypothetical protein
MVKLWPFARKLWPFVNRRAVEPARGALLFLHIRKTAGTSVTNLLLQRFAANRSLRGAHWRENDGLDPNQFDFVSGHVTFGYRARFRTPPVVLTFLREPVERAVSAWAFFREETPAALAKIVKELPAAEAALRLRFHEQARQITLLELLRREPALARPLLSNEQTRCLLEGAPGDLRPPATAAQLQAACTNLGRCDVIGLVEEMDASLAWLARRMGWDGLDARYDNRTNSRPARDAVEPDALEILSEWNRLDLALYEHARQLAAQRRSHARPAPAAPLPSLQPFNFDQPLHGIGWHDREFDARGCFCWTGAAQESWLDFQPPAAGGACRLMAWIAHAVHPEALTGLRIAVNTQPLAVGFRAAEEGVIVEAHVPPSALGGAGERVRISFQTSQRWRPCDLDADSGDRRTLGVALRRIELRAA